MNETPELLPPPKPKKEAPEKNWTEAEFIGLLSLRFAAPEYAFLSHVRNSTGFSRTIRTADGLAMSLYPSRGLHLTGFEIKCNRGDWKRELADPKKADDIGKHCHYWVIVAPSKCVPLEELPGSWGLLVPHGDTLKYAKQPLFNEHAIPPSYALLAGILRNASETMIPRAAVQKQLAAERTAGYRQGEENKQSELDRLRFQVEQEQLALKEFKQRSGLNPLDRYHGPFIKSELELASAMRGDGARRALNDLTPHIHALEAAARTLREHVKKSAVSMPEPDFSI